jgi:hypothetical protein
MKRKTLLISIVALATVLMASSILAISQAWCPIKPIKPKPEFIGYDFRQVPGAGEITYIDASGAPELIIMESTEGILEGTLTIGDQVYTYPEDFDYNGMLHTEFNAITGEGFARAEKTFIFNMHGKPILKSWLVVCITGLFIDPETGELIDPENMHSEGDFKLTGTKRFASVEGFGLEKDAHHFGFIKGWPL